MVLWGGSEVGDRKAGVAEGIWEVVRVVVTISSAESCKRKSLIIKTKRGALYPKAGCENHIALEP